MRKYIYKDIIGMIGGDDYHNYTLFRESANALNRALLVDKIVSTCR